MAGRSKKEDKDNFEKMKREMRAKKQRAKKNSSVVVENSDKFHMKFEKEIIHEPQIDEITDCIEEISKIQMVIFRIGEEEYAFETSNVKEIIRIPPMNNVPNSPFYIAGLCSLRGELLPVIDSRKLFGMADVEYDEGSRIVVNDIKGNKVGLIADKVSEVISIEEAMIKVPPASIRGMEEGIVKGILLLDDGKRVIMVLDAVKIVKAGNFNEYSKQQTFQDSANHDMNGKTSQEEQVILFNIGTEEYAFGIHTVKEIIRITHLTKVPNAAHYIEGILSIRNQLLAVINLGALLGKSHNNIDEQSRIVIIDDGNTALGVIVDRVSQVMRVQRDEFKGSELHTVISKMEYAKGFLELNKGKRLAMVLDPLKLVSFEDMDKVLTQSRKNDDNTNDKSESECSMEHVVIFKLDKEEFGISIHYIKEINRVSDIVHFPGAPIFIDGMVNLRGDVIPVLNLKTMFNSSIAMSDSSKFLVVEYENKKIGILIDSASEVLEIPKSHIEEASEMLKSKENEKDRYIDSIAKLNQGKRIVLILNLSATLSFM